MTLFVINIIYKQSFGFRFLSIKGLKVARISLKVPINETLHYHNLQCALNRSILLHCNVTLNIKKSIVINLLSYLPAFLRQLCF